jgi:hypothetical protein
MGCPCMANSIRVSSFGRRKIFSRSYSKSDDRRSHQVSLKKKYKGSRSKKKKISSIRRKKIYSRSKRSKRRRSY